jgi:hypothetical protein
MKADHMGRHEVRRGETLISIARQHKIRDWRTLWDAPENRELKHKRTSPNQIRPGDVVVIPSSGAGHSPAVTAEPEVSNSQVKHMLEAAHGKEASFAFGVSATGHKEDVLLVHGTRSAQQLREEIKRTTGLSAGNHGLCRWEGHVFSVKPVGHTQGGLASRLKQYFSKHGVSISKVECTEELVGSEKVFSMKYKGQTVHLTAKEKETVEKKIIAEIRGGIYHVINTQTNRARILYDRFKSINSKGTNQVVSWLIEATTRAELPSETVITEAERLRDTLKSYIDRGPKVMRQIVDFIGPAETASHNALVAMQDYRDSMMQGGESWVFGLELTKTTCFIVASAIATGGTSIGASLGASVVMAATESVSTETGRLIAGTKSQTFQSAATNIAADVINGVVAHKLGNTKIIKGLQSKVAERILKSTGSGPLRAYAAHSISEAIGELPFFNDVVTQAAKSISEGETMEQFVQNITVNFFKSMTVEQLAEAIKKRKK